MPLNAKLVSLDKMHNFCIGRISSVWENLKNEAKVPADMGGSTRSQGFLSGVLTKVNFG
jgi:hypothetical protein